MASRSVAILVYSAIENGFFGWTILIKRRREPIGPTGSTSAADLTCRCQYLEKCQSHCSHPGPIGLGSLRMAAVNFSFAAAYCLELIPNSRSAFAQALTALLYCRYSISLLPMVMTATPSSLRAAL